MRYLSLTLVVGVAILAIAGCGEGVVKPDASGTVAIDLTESAFTPSNIEVVAGTTVRFVLNNSGAEEHEFMIGRNVSRAPGYPDTFDTDFFDGLFVEVIGDPGGMVMAGEAMFTQKGEMVMEGGHGDDSEGAVKGMEGDDHGGMAMDADHGFMISQLAGVHGIVVIVEIPEDREGVWEIGCFVDEGAHYVRMA